MNIAQEAYLKGIRKATIGFSTGKDSLVGLSLLLNAGIETIPIYFYIVPELEFVEKSLKRYEELFEINIVRLPHPVLYDYINHQDWQPVDKAKSMYQVNLGKITFRLLTNMYLISKELKGFDYDCNCMKMADSLNRKLVLKNRPDIDEATKTIYLTKYFSTGQIFAYLKNHKIPLSEDYKIFGRSWDGLSYHFSMGVKKFYPNDFEKIREYFPLIDAEIMRYKIVHYNEFSK